MVTILAPPLNVAVAAQMLNYRFAMCGEYKTRSPYMPMQVPRTEPGDWSDGLETLAEMAQFFENQIHGDMIRRLVASIAEKSPRLASMIGVVKRWLPLILKAGALGLSVL